MSDKIAQLFAAWGMTDAKARSKSLRECLGDPFTYVDPRTPAPITDADGFVDYVAIYTEYAPGATAQVVGLSETKGHYRATVEFGMADGTKQHGQYFVEVDDAGRATRMSGFVGLGAPE